MTQVANDAALDLGRRAEAAMLAAAVGDALGWPQENRSSRVGGRRGVEPQLEFAEWRRREGGSYAPHEEVIAPGTYSDDTQLILAVARSLLRGGDWWRYFTSVELPFWPLYQRGGGGATRRAASSWAKGKPPWTDPKLVLGYFEAGGNGVAMRVLPHAIRHANDRDFEMAARNIVADGITTHGHPRAHVGGLAYGYSMWRALRRVETLGYGELIEETVDGVDGWGRRPRLDDVDPSWEDTVHASARDPYDSIWDQTVDEMLELLRTAREGIARGSLAVDRDTLGKLGSVGGPALGAGTVTAAASIFLASRYASRPGQGLVAAAFARGADTDTIASMTGAILGSINGDDWLGRALEKLQDRAYLSVVARHLVDEVPLAPSGDAVPQLTPAAIRRFWDKLERERPGGNVVLPDGRLATVISGTRHETKSRTNQITSWLVEAGDGQTLALKRTKKKAGDDVKPKVPVRAARPYRIGVVIEVDDLERALHFYRDIVGLEISKQSPQYVSFAGLLALAPAPIPRVEKPTQLTLADSERLFESRQTVTVFLAAAELDDMRAKIVSQGSVASRLSDRQGRRMFRCLDPDGNVLEFRELNGG